MKEEGREYVVGRGPKCDLVIDDREVSREHIKLMRKGYAIFLKDLSSTRGSWLGRSAVYTGATVEWVRPRMLRVGATVLSLDLPEFVRRAAPQAQASAPMTPPPRSRKNVGAVPQPTPSAPAVSSSRGSNALTPAPSQPLPGSAPAAIAMQEDQATRKLGAFAYDPAAQHAPAPTAMPEPAASGPAIGSTPRGLGSLPPPSPARKAWKKTGPTIGKASGLLLLALAGLVILGGLFVVFSLLE
jgi:hypothetical protein